MYVVLCPLFIPHHIDTQLTNFSTLSLYISQTDPASGLGVSTSDTDDGEYGSKLISIQNEVTKIHSSVQLVTSDDATSDQDALKVTFEAMSLIKGYIDDLQLTRSMPIHLQQILESTSNQITKAEKHMHKVEGVVSKYYGPGGLAETNLEEASKSSKHRRKLLSRNHGSNNNVSSTKYPFKQGITKADHHMRATARSHHLGQGPSSSFSNHFVHQRHHQQGYHGARALRQEAGGIGRRLTETDDGGGGQCIEVPSNEQKEEQCYRLADCAKNYGLYDMFVFLFADDINFGTGKVDDNIVVFDEVELREKVRIIALFLQSGNETSSSSSSCTHLIILVGKGNRVE